MPLPLNYSRPHHVCEFIDKFNPTLTTNIDCSSLTMPLPLPQAPRHPLAPSRYQQPCLKLNPWSQGAVS